MSLNQQLHLLADMVEDLEDGFEEMFKKWEKEQREQKKLAEEQTLAHMIERMLVVPSPFALLASEEFLTIDMKMPRGVGKTTTLQNLCYLICKKLAVPEIRQAPSIGIGSITLITSSDSKVAYILVDELGSLSAREIRDMAARYTSKPAYLVRLYT